ncbi:MAG: DUF2958 domain-containing protein [Deltaproteobacteria bacterium]|nr:DUF2958 domain-containing protein [Deltaproteobacteria bacterium]MBT4526757.1 DUF2958 domain-containing protein [Deltaproteobacteria bacterium]
MCWVQGLNEDKLGYVSLSEMEPIKGPLGIGIEQDKHLNKRGGD